MKSTERRNQDMAWIRRQMEESRENLRALQRELFALALGNARDDIAFQRFMRKAKCQNLKRKYEKP